MQKAFSIDAGGGVPGKAAVAESRVKVKRRERRLPLELGSED